MILAWTKDAWHDYLWCQTNDRALLRRINRVIEDILRGHDHLFGHDDCFFRKTCNTSDSWR
ncbi:MAG: type II toxin-antitoxin system YoeB family toxin [Magnetococcales bacterium]|nr:type II toxin-antitoxin system YoeB family toxin [Magnetococcales bacterium]